MYPIGYLACRALVTYLSQVINTTKIWSFTDWHQLRTGPNSVHSSCHYLTRSYSVSRVPPLVASFPHNFPNSIFSHISCYPCAFWNSAKSLLPSTQPLQSPLQCSKNWEKQKRNLQPQISQAFNLKGLLYQHPKSEACCHLHFCCYFSLIYWDNTLERTPLKTSTVTSPTWTSLTENGTDPQLVWIHIVLWKSCCGGGQR